MLIIQRSLANDPRCDFRAVEEAWSKRVVFSFYGCFADLWEMNVRVLCSHPHPVGSSTITAEVSYFHTPLRQKAKTQLRVMRADPATVPVSGWASPL